MEQKEPEKIGGRGQILKMKKRRDPLAALFLFGLLVLGLELGLALLLVGDMLLDR